MTHVLHILVTLMLSVKQVQLMDHILAHVLKVTKEQTVLKISTNVTKVISHLFELHYLNETKFIFITLGSPCEHNGICVNTPGSFACNCTQGFTGPRCETNINECESHPCQNEGSCLDDPGSFRCVCMPGI